MKKFIIYMLLLSMTLNSCKCFYRNNVEPYEVKIVAWKDMIVIEGSINGKRCNFLVDSGSDATMLDENQISEFHYTVTPGEMFSGLGGIVNVESVQDDDIIVSGFDVADRAYATNLMSVVFSVFKETGVRISGIIGADTFKANGFIIDYKNKKITINK